MMAEFTCSCEVRLQAFVLIIGLLDKYSRIKFPTDSSHFRKRMKMSPALIPFNLREENSIFPYRLSFLPGGRRVPEGYECPVFVANKQVPQRQISR